MCLPKQGAQPDERLLEAGDRVGRGCWRGGRPCQGAVPMAWETQVSAPGSLGRVSEGRTGLALKVPGGTYLSLPCGFYRMGVCCSI